MPRDAGASLREEARLQGFQAAHRVQAGGGRVGVAGLVVAAGAGEAAAVLHVPPGGLAAGEGIFFGTRFALIPPTGRRSRCLICSFPCYSTTRRPEILGRENFLRG